MNILYPIETVFIYACIFIFGTMIAIVSVLFQYFRIQEYERRHHVPHNATSEQLMAQDIAQDPLKNE